MRFRNRTDAGQQLAARLTRFRDQNPVWCQNWNDPISRGGAVVVAQKSTEPLAAVDHAICVRRDR